jgi:solute carrier family 26 (sodium-independent sulfate anion transporter), member 11
MIPALSAETQQQNRNETQSCLFSALLCWISLACEPFYSPTLMHSCLIFFSSHIDTTATQYLIDTRNEIERWVDHPVEFHFATILSPWTRRALIAGGFGIGTELSSSTTHDIAAVVPYRDGLQESSIVDVRDDVESGGKKHFAPSASILAKDTPFFHLDLQEAVKAAEKGIQEYEAEK